MKLRLNIKCDNEIEVEDKLFLPEEIEDVTEKKRSVGSLRKREKNKII